MLNYSGFDISLGNIRLLERDNDTFWGWRTINLNHLPKHKHNIFSWKTGEAGGTYRNVAVIPGGNHSGWDDGRNFGETRDTLDIDGKTYNQGNYVPASYLCYVYKKISNKKLDINNEEDKTLFINKLQILNIRWNNETSFKL